MKYLKQGWLVLLLAGVFAAGLSGVQIGLGPKIQKNQVDKTFRNIPKLVLPAAEIDKADIQLNAPEIKVTKDGKTRTLIVKQTPKDAVMKVYLVLEDQEKGRVVLGYVLEGSGPGYADTIITLIGLSPDLKTINGIKVLKQMETPNLGSKIDSPWANQYQGKASNPALVVVKDKTGEKTNNKIDAITGATISSESLTKIVNNTIVEFKNALVKEGEDALVFE